MISIITATRNDAYDGDSLHRNQVFVSSLVWLAEQHELDAELIIVEWDPPKGRAELKKAIRWPAHKKVKIRILSVPHKIHERIENSHLIPFFQMQAKNIGIRRAEGDWVLCTNADLIYSHELVKWLANADRKTLLDPLGYYRAPRYDTSLRRVSESPELLNPTMVDVWLEACRENVIAKHDPPEPGIMFTNACGDFTLAHQGVWEELKGYPEIGRWSPHVDSLFLIAAFATGHQEYRIAAPMYHLQHDKALVGLDETKTDYPYPILDLTAEYEPWKRLMLRTRRLISPNAENENWGFADEKITEHKV